MATAKVQHGQSIAALSAGALALGMAVIVLGAVPQAQSAPLEGAAAPVAQKTPVRSPSCTGTAATTGLVFANPTQLCPILAESGSAQIDRNNDGQEYISGTINGLNYSVDFHECETNCTDMSFISSFTLEGITMERMNEWNRTQRFGTAYVDSDGTAWVVWTINARFGISAETFRDDVLWWSSVMENFANHIGFR